jgi:hypothetical protein
MDDDILSFILSFYKFNDILSFRDVSRQFEKVIHRAECYDVNRLTNLLIIKGIKITKQIDLSQFKFLTKLDCRYCPLVKDFPEGLRILWCMDCPLAKDFPEGLIELWCSHCPLAKDFPKGLTELYCIDCPLAKDFPEGCQVYR